MSSCYKRLFRWTLVSFSFFLPCLPRNITGTIKIWQPPPLKRIFPPTSTTAPHFRERIYSYVHAIIRVLSGLKRDGFGRKFANSLFNPIQTAPSLINWITFNKTVQVRPPNLAKFIWEHFKVIVTCTSTLMLHGYRFFAAICFFFGNLPFFHKKRFYFYFYYCFCPHRTKLPS